MDIKDRGSKNGRWMELAQDRVQWRSLLFLLPVLVSFVKLFINTEGCVPQKIRL